MSKLLATIVLLIGSAAVLGADAAGRQGKQPKRLGKPKLAEMNGDEAASSAVYLPGEQYPVNMPPEHVFFRDFCISAQDDIKANVRQKLNGTMVSIYTVMLTSASKVGSELLKANAGAVQEANQVIMEAAVVRDARTLKDIDENVNKTLENMAANPRLFQRAGSSTRLVIDVIIDTARSLVFQRIAGLKGRLGSSQLRGFIEEACALNNADLLPKVNQRLAKAKQSLRQELDGQLLTKVQAADASTVGCTFSARVWKVAKLCEILKKIGPAVYTLVGIN